jgi:hypothetical protein
MYPTLNENFFTQEITTAVKRKLIPKRKNVSIALVYLGCLVYLVYLVNFKMKSGSFSCCSSRQMIRKNRTPHSTELYLSVAQRPPRLRGEMTICYCKSLAYQKIACQLYIAGLPPEPRLAMVSKGRKTMSR